MRTDPSDPPIGGTFQWPGRNTRGSVILSLKETRVGEFPDRITLPEVELVRKSELHLTLLSTREAGQLASSLPEADWQAAFEAEEWEMRFLDAFDLLQEERPAEPTRFSVIRRVHCPSLNAFRQRLTQAAGFDLPETLAHVTLYIAGNTRGIGLASLAEHERRRLRSLPADEVRGLLGPI